MTAGRQIFCFNPALQRVAVAALNLKGPENLSELDPKYQLGVQLLDLTGEDYGLFRGETSWEFNATSTGDATHCPAAELKLNAAMTPGNVLAIVDAIEVMTPTAGNVISVIFPTSLGVVSTYFSGWARDDRIIGARQSAFLCGASPGNNLLPGGIPGAVNRVATASANQFTTIPGPWMIAAGGVLGVCAGTVATTLRVNFKWRERIIGKSELPQA